MPFDPPPIFQPLRPPKNRTPSNPKSAKNSPKTKVMELRPSTPLDGNQLPQVLTSTFGEQPNKTSCHGLDTPLHPLFFSHGHLRNKLSLGSHKLSCIPMASEIKVELGLRGTTGSASLLDVDFKGADSDIPRELQFILTSNEEHGDTLFFTESGQ